MEKVEREQKTDHQDAVEPPSFSRSLFAELIGSSQAGTNSAPSRPQFPWPDTTEGASNNQTRPRFFPDIWSHCSQGNEQVDATGTDQAPPSIAQDIPIGNEQDDQEFSDAEINSAVRMVTEETVKSLATEPLGGLDVDSIGVGQSTSVDQRQSRPVDLYVPVQEFEITSTRNGRPTYKDGRKNQLNDVHAAAMELCHGDTLVFVDFPTSPGRILTDCTGFAFSSQQVIVSSEKLLATGSSRFAEMLGPTYQFRIQRRKKLVNKLPDGIKFVLDLTPPSEGDELVFQMTELSLTPGIIKWFRSVDYHNVATSVVWGHDDVCNCWLNVVQPTTESSKFLDNGKFLDTLNDRTAIVETQKSESISPEEKADIKRAIYESVKSMNSAGTSAANQASVGVGGKVSTGRAETLLRQKNSGEKTAETWPPHRKIPDYCPVRHCVHILRLLMIIEGKPCNVDSAVKAWTLCGVAKIFDCPRVVSTQILVWLSTIDNTKFVEVLPEEALQLAYTLQLPAITKAAFSILVNEAAIEEAATDGVWAPASQSQRPPVTVFGRKRQDPGDDLNNIIQHASRAMVARVTEEAAHIRNGDCLSVFKPAEWDRLLRAGRLLEEGSGEGFENARLAHLRLCQAVQEKLESKVRSASMFTNTSRMPQIDNDRASYVEAKDFESILNIYEGFNDVQKLLCPFIYDQLYKLIEEPDASTYPSLLGDNNLGSCWGEFRLAIMYLHNTDPAFASDPRWQEYLMPHDVFSPRELRAQLLQKIVSLGGQTPRQYADPPLLMSDHLSLSLGPDEIKFLPLWADGNDDGTGGVFEQALPPADYGPNGPGPAYHTGHTVPSDSSEAWSDASTISGSVLRDIQRMKLGSTGSTVGPGSVDVQDSISTVYDRQKVVADDASVRSEAWSDVNTDEFATARFAVPAQHQDIAGALDMMVSTTDDSEVEDKDDDAFMDYSDDDLDEDEDDAGTAVTPTLGASDEDSDLVLL